MNCTKRTIGGTQCRAICGRSDEYNSIMLICPSEKVATEGGCVAYIDPLTLRPKQTQTEPDILGTHEEQLPLI